MREIIERYRTGKVIPAKDLNGSDGGLQLFGEVILAQTDCAFSADIVRPITEPITADLGEIE